MTQNSNQVDPAHPEIDSLIHDWNAISGDSASTSSLDIHFVDETLRDGLQSPSIRDPEIEQKISMLHLMEKLGIDCVDLGLPGSGPRAVKDITRLAQEIKDNHFNIKAYCAVRTHPADIRPLIDISQKVGTPIAAAAFIGSSPIRQYAEGWTVADIIKKSVAAVKLATDNGLPVMYVTEDTTRATPDDIRALYKAAIDNGAERICICDTCGHATPAGTRNLLKFVNEIISETGADIKVDWHGHNDRGLGVANSLTAIYAGVDRVHGTILGIGERVGNASLDQILVNLKLNGALERDLTSLAEYCELVREHCHGPLPNNYPVMGADAFRTATGVHAAAIIKAEVKGEHWLADRVYSAVPAGDFGKEQVIEIGFMSGLSNVKYWLRKHEIEGSKEELAKIAEEILAVAKSRQENLRNSEVLEIIDRCKSGALSS